MTSRRIGILGGTFDPIHCGHVDAARAAESALQLTEIIVIPSHSPPHRAQPAASSYHRFAMVALAITGRQGWRASDIELGLSSPSFTTDTLQRLQSSGFAATELFFIIGADAFAEIESWVDYPAILDRAHFAVVSRPGSPVGELPVRLEPLAPRMAATADVAASRTPSIFLIDAPTTDVSATAIRRELARGASVAGLVPPGVRQYIEQHALYSTLPAADFGVDTRQAPAAGRLHGKG